MSTTSLPTGDSVSSTALAETHTNTQHTVTGECVHITSLSLTAVGPSLSPFSTAQVRPAQVAVGVDQSSHRQCMLWVSLSILSVVSEDRGCLTVRAPRGVQGVGGLADTATLDAPLDVDPHPFPVHASV